MWVGTSGYGLLRMSIKKENNKYIVTDAEQFISSDRVKPMNNDVVYTIVSAGNMLWFGTRGGGLYKIIAVR